MTTSMIDPRMVRRACSPDVFVTSLGVTDQHTFEVGVRWPAGHPFYGPCTPDTHDPLLFLESVRQAGLLVAHAGFEIPTEFKFITHEKRFAVIPSGLRTAGADPVDLQITIAAHDIRPRGRGVAGACFEFTGTRDGVRIGTAAYRWSCVSAGGYARLRGDRLTAMPPPRNGRELVRPSLAGRRDEIDVMLAERLAGPGWELTIDPGHPVVFDHHIDHVPGNAAIEVARQAALLAAGRPDALPVGGVFAFQRYIEFDQPCLVSADGAGSGPVRVVFEQGGDIAAEGSFAMLLPE
jgi:2-oxo-3-(phosphooxy)propyl 3-oxoalkanoate synthase